LGFSCTFFDAFVIGLDTAFFLNGNGTANACWSELRSFALTVASVEVEVVEVVEEEDDDEEEEEERVLFLLFFLEPEAAASGLLPVLISEEAMDGIWSTCILSGNRMVGYGCDKMHKTSANNICLLSDYHWYFTSIEIQIDLGGLTTSQIRLKNFISFLESSQCDGLI
jgi:hypothetical protein